MLVKKQHGEPLNPAALRRSGRVGRGALNFALNAQGRVGRGWGVSPADLTTDPLSGKEPEPCRESDRVVVWRLPKMGRSAKVKFSQMKDGQ